MARPHRRKSSASLIRQFLEMKAEYDALDERFEPVREEIKLRLALLPEGSVLNTKAGFAFIDVQQIRDFIPQYTGTKHPKPRLIVKPKGTSE